MPTVPTETKKAEQEQTEEIDTGLEKEKLPEWLQPWLHTIVRTSEDIPFSDYVDTFFNGAFTPKDLEILHRDFSEERIDVIEKLIDSGELDKVNPRTTFAVIAKLIQGRDPLENLLATFDKMEDSLKNTLFFSALIRDKAMSDKPLESIVFGSYRKGDYLLGTLGEPIHTRSGGNLVGFPASIVVESMEEIYNDIEKKETQDSPPTAYNIIAYTQAIRSLVVCIHPITDGNSRAATMFAEATEHRLMAKLGGSDKEKDYLNRYYQSEQTNPDVTRYYFDMQKSNLQFRVAFTSYFLEKLKDPAIAESVNLNALKDLESREEVEKPDFLSTRLEQIAEMVSNTYASDKHGKTVQEVDEILSGLIRDNSEVLAKATKDFIGLVGEYCALGKRSEQNAFLLGTDSRDLEGTSRKLTQAESLLFVNLIQMTNIEIMFRDRYHATVDSTKTKRTDTVEEDLYRIKEKAFAKAQDEGVIVY